MSHRLHAYARYLPAAVLVATGLLVAGARAEPGEKYVKTPAGDVECWASGDGGRTWQKRGTPAPHEPDTNRMNVAAGRAADATLRTAVYTCGTPLRVVDFQGDGGCPSSAQLPDGQVLTAYYASRIEGHHRYHMGVVVWQPPPAQP